MVPVETRRPPPQQQKREMVGNRKADDGVVPRCSNTAGAASGASFPSDTCRHTTSSSASLQKPQMQEEGKQQHEKKQELTELRAAATEVAAKPVTSSSSTLPITRPIVLVSTNRGVCDSSTSSAGSCTPGDLRAVEEELKELLSGYHRLVGSAPVFCEVPGAIIPSPKTAAVAGTDVTPSPLPNVVNTPPLVAAMRRTGNSQSNPDSSRESGGAWRSGGAGGYNRHGHSVASLPVSSVHGEHSTEANTPTPCVQMPQNLRPVRSGGGSSSSSSAVEGDSGVHSTAATAPSCAALPSARAASPVDLFAEALTEDHLNRSFEMRWKQQLRVGSPSLHVVPNHMGDRLALDTSPLLDDGTGYPAMRREAGSPVPPFINCNLHSLDNCGLAGHDTRTYAAYRYQAGTPSALNKTSPLDVVGSSKDAAEREQLGVAPDHGDGDGAPRKIVTSELEQKPLTTLHSRHHRKPQRRIASRRHHHGGIDSTTPEIATSARRTEDPSTRSGAASCSRMAAATSHGEAGAWYNLIKGMRGTDLEGDGTYSGEFSAPMVNTAVPNNHNEQQQQHPLRHFVMGPRNGGLQRRHQDAVTRFHAMVERRVAALESGSSEAGALPAFADSLVGAAIKDLCPVVKRRQAQLKESQHAEAAAAAAADASLTRNTIRGSMGTVTSTPSTTPTPSSNVRSSRDSYAVAYHNSRPSLVRSCPDVGQGGVATGGTPQRRHLSQRRDRHSRRESHAH
ncbi:hypothetical protein DQ04_09391010 [Trypanosoma grayi]|uniref:hypothetical protein n=1 Tax=Trypanosoma grayi TaxID=71804 RepID=UPI0004F4BB78|nr:hypothetical protein DQ04_09391010 [Trypanosoma grayi]KEG07573.1 hypothetical protein DQ04_09391010 [Trypanosoma grayi]